MDEHIEREKLIGLIGMAFHEADGVEQSGILKCRKIIRECPVAKKKTQQRVVRTRRAPKGYPYDPSVTQNLNELLKQGYRVVMCHPVGDEELEYIVEKYVEED